MTGRSGLTLRLGLTLLCASGLLDVRAGQAAGAGARPRLPDLPALVGAVRETESWVAKAYFERAISIAEATREWADEVPADPEARQARARLEVLTCTAQVALGDEDAALRSMQRAVFVWPLLSLDESTTSPRVVKLFHQVRGNGGSRSASR